MAQNPELDYTHILLAPGQGNQRPGMGLELAKKSPEARKVWTIADQVLRSQLHQKLSETVWNGTTADLRRTEIAQLAIITDTLARAAALREADQLGNPGWYAGNSVGMIAALFNAGSLDIASTVTLAKGRGDAFRLAIDQGQKTTMVALAGVERDVMLDVKDRFELEICLANSDTQIVLGGPVENIQNATAHLREQGLENRVFPLDVDAAFHSKYLAPAVEAWTEVVNGTPVEAPKYGKVIGGSTVSELVTPEQIRRELVLQLTGRERYRDLMWYARAREVTTMTELNSSTRLTKINMEIFGIPDDPAPFVRLSTLKVSAADKTVVIGYRLVNPCPGKISRDEISNWYIDYLAKKQGMDPGDLTEDMEFVNDVGLESIDLKALRAAIKNKFGRVVPDDEAAENTTIASAIEATYRLANS